MNQKDLIKSIQQLKEIKPRQEWASLLKSQILNPKSETIVAELKNPAQKVGFWGLVGSWDLGFGISRRLAYSFATVLMFVSVLSFGLYLFPAGNKADQTASLTGQNALKNNVVALNTNIKSLQTSTTKRTAAIKEINDSVKQLAMNLKKNPADSSTIKEIANGLRTLSSVPGTNLSENSEIAGLYETVVQAQIADLKKSTLTKDQQKEFEGAQVLFSKGNYGAALEKIWYLTNSSSSSSESSSSSSSSISI